MKGDSIMDENTPIQTTTDPKQECLALMNKLLATLTVFERNVKILHWNYQYKDFVSVHPWLDDVHDDVCECIDTIAEEIRKGDFFPDATLQQCIENTGTPQINSNVRYDHKETFNVLARGLSSIRVLADMLSTKADENKFWTIQDVANGILSKMNHHMYFVKGSFKQDDDD